MKTPNFDELFGRKKSVFDNVTCKSCGGKMHRVGKMAVCTTKGCKLQSQWITLL